MKDLILSFPIPILILQTDNHSIIVNLPFTELFKIPAKEMIPIDKVITGNNKNLINKILDIQSTCDKDNTLFRTSYCVDQLNEKSFFSVSAFNMTLKNKTLLITIWQDLNFYYSDIKNLNDNLIFPHDEYKNLEMVLSNLLKNLPLYVYWKDKESIFRGCNDRLAKFAGLEKAEDLFGKTDFELSNLEEAHKIRENDKKVMKEKNSIMVEETGYHPETKKPINVMSYKAPMLDSRGEVTGVLGISVDITEKNLQLEKVLEKYKNFVLNQEHDIRTPIAGVVILAENLKYELKDTSYAEIAEALYNSAKEQLAYQNSLIDTIYLFYNETEVYHRRFMIRSLLNQIHGMFSCAILEKKLCFECQIERNIPDFLVGDCFRLQQILVRLMDNAIKFTEHGGIIRFNCQGRLRNDTTIILDISIEDTGIGFDDSQKETIFEPFNRLTLSNIGKYEGRGVGLAFVKKLIEEIQIDGLKAEIDVSSIPGVGSVFRILVPCTVSLDQSATEQPLQRSKA